MKAGARGAKISGCYFASPPSLLLDPAVIRRLDDDLQLRWPPFADGSVASRDF